MSGGRSHPLLELDPELGRLLSAERRELALTRLTAEVTTIPAGDWDAERTLDDPSAEQLGLLLLEGVVTSETTVDDTVSAELLGPGDVLRPWAMFKGDRLLVHRASWHVLSRARVAKLDQRFTGRLASWPEVNAVLIDRVNNRAQRLATTQAISQLNGVDRRVLALLWHLAERWGRVSPDGVVVPLPLSHRTLSRLVGARRPSVSTAIAALARRRELIRQDDGSWLLTGEPVGAPVEATARVVPIRRRLVGREMADAVPLEAVPEATGPLPSAQPSLAELREAFLRVQETTRAGLDQLRTRLDESAQLIDDAERRRAPP